AAVPRHLYLAVARSRPDLPSGARRLGDRRNAEPGNASGNSPLGVRQDLVRWIRGQIGTDFLPVVTAVRGFEQHLRAGVNDLAVVRRYGDGRFPNEAERRFTRIAHRL